MNEIRITLETLYDILRNEKKKEDLQKLDDSFFVDVISYVREKKSLLENQQDNNELFGNKEKLEYELRSIKRILKEIYEKREKKIIDIALNRSRTGSDLIDTSSMLKEEKDFYQELLKSLDSYRKGILLNLSRGELPGILNTITSPEIKNKISAPTLSDDKNDQKSSNIFNQPKEELTQTTEKETTTNNKNKIIKTKVKFIHPTPSFIWKDMKVYGPYDEGEEVNIFPEVADLLVRKGRVEKV